MKKKKGETRPPQPLPLTSGFRVEVKPMGGGRRRVLLTDCHEILAYSHERVAFLHGREQVVVEGEELWCRSWGNRVAEVVGRVKEIRFGEGKNLC